MFSSQVAQDTPRNYHRSKRKTCTCLIALSIHLDVAWLRIVNQFCDHKFIMVKPDNYIQQSKEVLLYDLTVSSMFSLDQFFCHSMQHVLWRWERCARFNSSLKYLPECQIINASLQVSSFNPANLINLNSHTTM